MTERPQTARGPGPMPVIVTALAGFVVVLAILVAQMSAGKDPVVTPAAAPVPTRKIVHRRIVVRRVIVTDAPARTSGEATGPAPAPASPPPAHSAPVQVVQAPPPPPPPAPVTRTS
jgi:hypothetical protein